MFIAHYGLSYVASRKYETLPLWLLFVAVQLLDLLAFVFVLTGIESATYAAADNPFFRNHIDLPITHSLIGALIISAIFYGLIYRSRWKAYALILGLLVLSHWFIDFFVHQPDLTLWFSSYKVGLGLWQYPMISYAVEVIIVIGTWFLLKEKNIYAFLLLLLMVAGFSGMVFREEPLFLQQNGSLRTALVLVVNGFYILLAWLWDRRTAHGPSVVRE